MPESEVIIHEAGIAENIIQIVEQAAQNNNMGSVARVVLEIGQFSGVDPTLLRYAFDWVIKGTIMEKAEIEILTPPLLLYCRNCETEYLGELEDLRCPVCMGEEFDTIQGREMLVKSIVGG